MSKLLQRLLVVGALLTPAAARADYVSIRRDPLIAQFSASAINSIKWTGWIEVSEFRSIVFEINYTWNAGSAVTMRCESSDDPTIANDAGFDLHLLSEAASAGTLDSNTLTWSNAVTASEKWTWTVSNLPHDYINCGYTATSGNASDVATVKRKRITP